MRSKFWLMIGLLAMMAILAAQCGGPAPTPQTIVETVMVNVKPFLAYNL